MPSDKNQHQGHPQQQHDPGGHPQQQHGGQTYDTSGQPTSPSAGYQASSEHPQQGGQQPQQPPRPGGPTPPPGQPQPQQPPGQDRPPHRDTPGQHQPRPGEPGYQPPQPSPAREASPADKAAADKAAAETREAQAAGSIGAQVILDFNSQAGLAARGGAAATIEENTMLRDANLIAVGLDPASPSGPPTGEPWEPPAVAMAAAPKHVTSQATKMSSLAAGIQDLPEPPPPPARAGH